MTKKKSKQHSRENIKISNSRGNAARVESSNSHGDPNQPRDQSTFTEGSEAHDGFKSHSSVPRNGTTFEQGNSSGDGEAESWSVSPAYGSNPSPQFNTYTFSSSDSYAPVNSTTAFSASGNDTDQLGAGQRFSSRPSGVQYFPTEHHTCRDLAPFYDATVSQGASAWSYPALVSDSDLYDSTDYILQGGVSLDGSQGASGDYERTPRQSPR